MGVASGRRSTGLANTDNVESFERPARVLLAQVAARARVCNDDPIGQSRSKVIAIFGNLRSQSLSVRGVADDKQFSCGDRIPPFASQRRSSDRSRQDCHDRAACPQKYPQYGLLERRMKPTDHRVRFACLLQRPCSCCPDGHARALPGGEERGQRPLQQLSGTQGRDGYALALGMPRRCACGLVEENGDAPKCLICKDFRRQARSFSVAPGK